SDLPNLFPNSKQFSKKGAIWPFFLQLPKWNFLPLCGFINLGEPVTMKAHLGWLAGRKERYMKITKLLSHTVLIFGLAFTLSTFALAQDDQVQDQDQNQPDPPSRVGRVNMVQGSVSFQPGGEGDWVDAVPNRPLTSGDN